MLWRIFVALIVAAVVAGACVYLIGPLFVVSHLPILGDVGKILEGTGGIVAGVIAGLIWFLSGRTFGGAPA